jgi:hypothetical protein
MTGVPGPLSPVEFVYWQAFWEIEPFGPVQEDLRAGLQISTTHNAWFKERCQPDQLFRSLQPPPEIVAAQNELRELWNMKVFVARHNARWRAQQKRGQAKAEQPKAPKREPRRLGKKKRG